MKKLLALLIGAASLLVTPAYADFTGKNAAAATVTFKNPNDCTLAVCIPIFALTDGAGTSIYGTAGTANANILTVQGIASMTPLLATVTGSVNATLGTTQNTNLANIDSQTSRLTSSATNIVAGSALATTSFVVGSRYLSTPPTFTNGQEGAFQISSAGRLLSDTNAAQSGTWNITNISGTVSLPTGAGTAANQASQLTQETATATGIGAPADAAWVSGSGSTIAILKNIATGVAGPVPAGTNPIGKVAIDQTTPGTTNLVAIGPVGSGVQATAPRLTLATDSPGIIQVGTPTATAALAANLVAKASAGTLFSFEASADSTLSAAAWWVMIYNATSAPADGAVTPLKCYAVPSGTTSYSAAFTAAGIAFSTGITLGVSTTGCFTKTASTHAFISADFQ